MQSSVMCWRRTFVRSPCCAACSYRTWMSWQSMQPLQSTADSFDSMGCLLRVVFSLRDSYCACKGNPNYGRCDLSSMRWQNILFALVVACRRSLRYSIALFSIRVCYHAFPCNIQSSGPYCVVRICSFYV